MKEEVERLQEPDMVDEFMENSIFQTQNGQCTHEHKDIIIVYITPVQIKQNPGMEKVK